MFLMSFLVLTLNSCKKDKGSEEPDYMEYKEIAWNSLSEAYQTKVLHDWQDAEATLTTNPDDHNDAVVVVVFHTTLDAVLCPISVYVDYENKVVIHPKNIYLCD